MRTLISLLILSYCICALHINGIGQNIISNPSFENGSTVTWTDQIYKATGWSKDCGLVYAPNIGPPDYGVPGTPDLFDKNCYNLTEDHCVGIPYNKWATLNERTNKNRYANLSGGSTQIYNGNNIVSYGETVKGTLTAGLVANCVYSISFYAAAIQGYHINGSQLPPTFLNPDPNYNKIQVVLRKDDDCSNQLVIFEL